MLRYSQEETRRSIMDLRSQALESRDLAGALTDLARQMTSGHGAIADVRVEGTPHRLDASHEHHLLRIGLEALTNALKHSGAAAYRHRRSASLRMHTELIVQDDGCGLGAGSRRTCGGRISACRASASGSTSLAARCRWTARRAAAPGSP